VVLGFELGASGLLGRCIPVCQVFRLLPLHTLQKEKKDYLFIVNTIVLEANNWLEHTQKHLTVICQIAFPLMPKRDFLYATDIKRLNLTPLPRKLA
jgi:hypothetical protein